MWMVVRSGALVLSMTFGAAVFAQGNANPTASDVIQDQLDAFLADDFETAFTFASPMIKNMFRNPSNFGAMVRQGYPMVWRPADVRFGAAQVDGTTVYQRVIITDASGALHALEYEMIPDGESYKINGVRFLRMPDVGA